MLHDSGVDRTTQPYTAVTLPPLEGGNMAVTQRRLHKVAVLLASTFILVECHQNGTPTVYRMPVLETVVQARNDRLWIVPEAADGSYWVAASPSQLRFRVQGDVNVKI